MDSNDPKLTLGEIIRKYRKEHGISMDVFANRSKLSKGYISMLEKNLNPTTGKGIIPTTRTVDQAAMAMNIAPELLYSQISTMQDDVSGNSTNEASNLPPLTPKDEREIARDLENMINSLDDKNAMAAMGGTVDDEEDRELLKASLLTSMRLAKQIAKKKFTPKKYRKNSDQ